MPLRLHLCVSRWFMLFNAGASTGSEKCGGGICQGILFCEPERGKGGRGCGRQPFAFVEAFMGGGFCTIKDGVVA